MAGHPSSPLADIAKGMSTSYERLISANAVLNASGIAHAVCGGFAVSTWCMIHDLSAPRNLRLRKPVTIIRTQDADFLVRGSDVDAIIAVMSDAGYEYVMFRQYVRAFVRAEDVRGLTPRAKMRHAIKEAVQLVVKDDSPDVFAADADNVTLFSTPRGPLPVLNIEPLVRMKLAVKDPRFKDMLHLLELWECGALTIEMVQRIAFHAGWLDDSVRDAFFAKVQTLFNAAANTRHRRFHLRGILFWAQLQRIVAEIEAGKLPQDPTSEIVELIRGWGEGVVV